MKIYTLTGDKGTTALASGQRVDKDCTRVEAYGTIDELNAQIGLLAHHVAQTPDSEMLALLHRIQNRLFNIGAYLSTDGADTPFGLTAEHIAALEQHIDQMEAPFRGFCLPGGCLVSAQAEVCRTIARRAERRIVSLAKEAPVHTLVLQYINRLSDFLFVFARFNNNKAQVPEIYWNKNA